MDNLLKIKQNQIILIGTVGTAKTRGWSQREPGGSTGWDSQCTPEGTASAGARWERPFDREVRGSWLLEEWRWTVGSRWSDRSGG